MIFFFLLPMVPISFYLIISTVAHSLLRGMREATRGL